jgi:hypothetical protein
MKEKGLGRGVCLEGHLMLICAQSPVSAIILCREGVWVKRIHCEQGDDGPGHAFPSAPAWHLVAKIARKNYGAHVD